MVMASIKTGSFFSIVLLVIAVLYKRYTDEVLKERLHEVLSGLLRAEKKVPLPKARIAVGFGGCLDVVADALTVLEKMNLTDCEVPEHMDVVDNSEKLSKLFAYFFQHGAAAERYVSNDTFFEEVLAAVESYSQRQWFLGGNAPVMANRLALEGNEVLLATSHTPMMLESIQSGVKVIGKNLKKADTHILLEYKTGDKWGKYTSPRANRLILHSDDVNPYIDTLEAFQDELKGFGPSLLIVGGLQMMDNFPFEEGARLQRLRKLQGLLSNTPLSTKIHFEMASFTDSDLMKEIIDNVVYYSDSLGMNEQELPNLMNMLQAGNITLVADSYPRIANVLDQMRTLYRILVNTKLKPGQRRLTRLHIHTLGYQIILTTNDSAWKNSMSASAKAALTAHRHVCGSHSIDVDKARLIMDDSFSTSISSRAQRILFREQSPVSCWGEEDYQICLAPVLVCTQVIKTGGGGDNVSSAGLVLQA